MHESFEMPPDTRLSENVVADFKQWILAGAFDPRDKPANSQELSLRKSGKMPSKHESLIGVSNLSRLRHHRSTDEIAGQITPSTNLY